LGNRDSLVPEPRSTPSSTPISTISNSLVMIHTANIPPASNAQTPQLDDSTELEVSTLASSTLVSTKQHSIPPPRHHHHLVVATTPTRTSERTLTNERAREH
jgi:hypothetical protein